MRTSEASRRTPQAQPEFRGRGPGESKRLGLDKPGGYLTSQEAYPTDKPGGLSHRQARRLIPLTSQEAYPTDKPGGLSHYRGISYRLIFSYSVERSIPRIDADSLMFPPVRCSVAAISSFSIS